MKKLNKKWISIMIPLLWIMAGICFYIWMLVSYQAKGIDKEDIESNQAVKATEENDWYSFVPTLDHHDVVIFYPGAMVDPKAYIPFCRKLSDNGCKVLLMKMPWRLAAKGYNRPKELNVFADTTKQYIMAGHSQGAKMAAQFVYENPTLVDKLVLIATTHPRDIDLSDLNIKVMKIYGSKDGVANMSDVDKNKPKLPPATKYVLIEGANHSQFGNYGFQLGDHKADVTRQQQQQIALTNILAFINEPNTIQ